KAAMDGNDHSAMLCVVYITTYCQITVIIHDSTGLPRILLAMTLSDLSSLTQMDCHASMLAMTRDEN
ncbi:hypothetical protein, partial [Cysteiniphilum sp. 6C5]|uniref:hypothetical protein n=1 Tax=unclassified Cysteiniphilum TaxID=2610889 RepID=UPI003F84898B